MKTPKSIFQNLDLELGGTRFSNWFKGSLEYICHDYESSTFIPSITRKQIPASCSPAIFPKRDLAYFPHLRAIPAIRTKSNRARPNPVNSLITATAFAVRIREANRCDGCL